MKEPSSSSDSKSHSVLSGASRMGAAVFISRMMGLVREQAFALLFGAGTAMDAFAVAFRIPNLLRDLFAEGAMSSALVPTFVSAREKEGEERAWRVASLVFKVLFISVSILTGIAYFFVEDLIHLYAGSFSQIPGKFELTVLLTQVMFPYFPLVALAAAFMGILNALGAFFIPAFSSALFNVVSVSVGALMVWVFHRFPVFPPIVGMAIGVVTGGAVQAFFQLPLLFKKGFHTPKRTTAQPVWFRDPYLKQMLMLMVPGTLGMAGTQINILVNTMLATGAGDGAVSWLQYAFRLMQFPIGLFGVSLAAATLPAVSQAWSRNDFGSMNQTLAHSIRRVLAINLPAAVGLAVLAGPIIRAIFQYGAFTEEDTRATAYALQGYALGLPFYSLVKVLVPAFYGMGNTRIPVISSVLAVLANVILNVWWVKLWGFVGLALGTSAAACANATFLFWALKRRLHTLQLETPPLGGRGLYISLLKSALSAGVMGGGCYSALKLWEASFMEQALSAHALGRLFQVGSLVGLGVVILLGAARLFHAEDTSEIFNFLKRKLFRSRTK